MNKDFQLGLLHLVHLLISADGYVDDNELSALEKVKRQENIPDSVFKEFTSVLITKKEREIYQDGIDHLNRCSDSEKLAAFVHLYRLSELDGHMHVKEVRLLLYSVKLTAMDFDDVVARASKK